MHFNNMLYRLLIIIFCSGLSHFVHASSTQSYAVDLLKGEGNITGMKVAYRYHAPSLQNLVGHARFYFESSVNLWHSRHAGQSQTNVVLAMSPVMQFPAFNFDGKLFLIEAGIGISVLEDSYFAGKDLSTHYQFEDRIGIVTHFANTDIALRVIHYSNAGFKHPNPGLNFVTLSVAKRF